MFLLNEFPVFHVVKKGAKTKLSVSVRIMYTGIVVKMKCGRTVGNSIPNRGSYTAKSSEDNFFQCLTSYTAL